MKQETYIVVSETEIVKAEMESPEFSAWEMISPAVDKVSIINGFVEHCLSLPRIPIHGNHNWKVWQEVVEGKDFEFGEGRPIFAMTDKGIKNTSGTVAFPIEQTKSEQKNYCMVTLEELLPGTLFKHNNTIAIKSEYRTDDGAIEAYIVGSGEMFWGGTTKPDDLGKLNVTPLDYHDLETLWRDIDLILDFADFNDSQKIKMIKEKIHSYNKKIKL